MEVAVLVIFGRNWGSGHVSRALVLQRLLKEKVTIFAKLENASDANILDKYSESIRHNFSFDDLTRFDVIINDTLGLFQFPDNFGGRKIYVDAIHFSKSSIIDNQPSDCEFYSILYPNSGKSVNDPSIFQPAPKPMVAVFQGGGDDHEQILKIAEKIPSDYAIVAGVGFNCRHIEHLNKYAALRGNSGVLIGVNPITLAKCADVIVTAGGNTLFELLQQPLATPIILYSKEAKEHLTFQQVATHPRIIEWIPLENDFRFPESLLSISSAETVGLNSIF